MRHGLAPRGSATTSAICTQWLVEDPILERLSQDFEDMALELGQLIQEQQAMVRQRHLARHGQLTTAEHAHSGDRLVRGPERTGSEEGGASGDTRGPGGLEGLGQTHRGPDGGAALYQSRRAGPRGAEEQEMMDGMPAMRSTSP